MKKVRWIVGVLAVLTCAAVTFAYGQQQQGEPVIVGHIAHIEGSLLRYVPENKDWVATVKDAPFGLQDVLYTDQAARGEIVMPNATLLRIGGSTQVQLLRLSQDMTEIDVASGKARFYNNSDQAAIRVTTPFGEIVAPAGAVFDLYVGDESLEVIGIRGKVDYVHPEGNTKYDVLAGSSSIIASRTEIASGEGLTDSSWNSWNAERDSVWERRNQARGDSGRNLPPVLHNEAYALEENGRWESVVYDGAPRQFWRPTAVSAAPAKCCCVHCSTSSSTTS